MTRTEDSRSSLLVEIHDATVVIIRINRPAQRNALSQTILEALDATTSQIAEQTNVKAIVFTGTEDVFASGADIRELQTLDVAKAREFAERGQRIFQKIADAPQLTIAAINGYCMGGGLDLALACDARVASSGAVFAHPGANLGIVTGWGGTQRLPRLVGRARALEMFFTARPLTSREALEWNLIDRISDPVLEGALEVARSVLYNKHQ
ncbi:MAG: enoyl-CoA hydratase/isomerase family protein [Pyrinomonadaceae bacterium]|nr:enoyl-CoA hydratase/isomerase family protein [Pyrinomonadaceae bacterium]